MTKRKLFTKLQVAKSLRFRIEKWVWVVATFTSGFLRWQFPGFWEMIEGIVITLMSSYALVLTLAGAEAAAEAAEIAERNGKEQ